MSQHPRPIRFPQQFDAANELITIIEQHKPARCLSDVLTEFIGNFEIHPDGRSSVLDAVFVVSASRYMSEITYLRWVHFVDHYSLKFKGAHSYNMFDELAHSFDAKHTLQRWAKRRVAVKRFWREFRSS